MNCQELRALVEQIGPMERTILQIVEIGAEGPKWLVRFERMDVRSEHLPGPGQIAVFATFDGPRGDVEGPALRALMAANMVWRDSGGVRFSLGSSNNLIEVAVTLPFAGTTAHDLAMACVGIAQHAMTWSLLFDGGIAPPATGEAGPEYDPEMMCL